MAKPNYAFDKRQKELAKKKKQEEKRLQKTATDGNKNPDSQVSTDAVETTPTDSGS
jgi:hypothetical protein